MHGQGNAADISIDVVFANTAYLGIFRKFVISLTSDEAEMKAIPQRLRLRRRCARTMPCTSSWSPPARDCYLRLWWRSRALSFWQGSALISRSSQDICKPNPSNEDELSKARALFDQ